MRAPCSGKARTCLENLSRLKDIAVCNILGISSRLSARRHVGGKWRAFRPAAWFSTRVSTPWMCAKSSSEVEQIILMVQILC